MNRSLLVQQRSKSRLRSRPITDFQFRSDNGTRFPDAAAGKTMPS